MSVHPDTPIARQGGDDVVVQLRLRRANWEALTYADGVEVHGRMRLIPDDDGINAIVVEDQRTMPGWPEAVPANQAARERAAHERAR